MCKPCAWYGGPFYLLSTFAGYRRLSPESRKGVCYKNCYCTSVVSYFLSYKTEGGKWQLLFCKRVPFDQKNKWISLEQRNLGTVMVLKLLWAVFVISRHLYCIISSFTWHDRLQSSWNEIGWRKRDRSMLVLSFIWTPFTPSSIGTSGNEKTCQSLICAMF